MLAAHPVRDSPLVNVERLGGLQLTPEVVNQALEYGSLIAHPHMRILIG